MPGVMLTVSVFDMWWPIVSRPLTAADGSRLHVVLMSVLQLGVGAALYGVLAQVMPEEVPLPHVVEAAQRGAKTHTGFVALQHAHARRDLTGWKGCHACSHRRRQQQRRQPQRRRERGC